jgi:hypothetical protein
MAKYLNRNFKLCLLLALIILVAGTAIFATMGYNYAQTPKGNYFAGSLLDSIRNMAKDASWESIFTNNLLLSVLDIVPFLGVFVYVFGLASTSYAIGMLAGALNASLALYTTQIYLYGALELFAYIILTAEGIHIAYLIVKRPQTITDRLKHHTWKTAIIYFLALLIAALIELLPI